MCVDFTNLNAACPKDSYSPPSTDNLIDKSVGCELLSFMDAYFVYNQNLLYNEDKEKTSFITKQGTFCFKVMLFDLKNAEATFKRLKDHIFQHQIGRNLEVYLDEILVKSKKAEDDIWDLQETFQTLAKYGVKLNARKCSF